MPRTPMPKPYTPGGISQFDRIGDDNKKYPYLDKYPPEIMGHICEEHEIEGKDARDKLWHTLEHRAIAYFSAINRLNNKATIPEIRNQLNKLEKAIGAFNSQWEQLHPHTEYWLLRAADEFYSPASEDFNALLKSGAATKTTNSAGEEIKTFYEPENLHRELSFLEHSITKAKSLLPQDEGGRPFNLPLYDFVSGMAWYWAKELGRPFTIDEHKGIGTTLAAKFLEDCITPIDPKLVSSLPSMMKRVRTDLNLPRRR